MSILNTGDAAPDRDELLQAFDFIVCGAGTSGSVIAGRLAATPDVSVLLVEAGGSDETEAVSDPNLWPTALGGALDWGFITDRNPRLNDRTLLYSMGKVLGGGSSTNVSTWSRGHKTDWDEYERLTRDPRWGYDGVLDLYRRKIEDWVGEPDPAFRGKGGVVRVQPSRRPSAFSEALLSAAEEAGLPRFPNANGAMMEAAAGASLVDETVVGGRRKSIFQSYAQPLTGKRNLTIVTHTTVARVIVERGRAVAVELDIAGSPRRVMANFEVILCCGAVQTPKLLMQSGIGEEEELARFGIPLVQPLRGVGKNLHDHVAFACVWGKIGEPMPATPRSETACFWKTSTREPAPNMYSYAVTGAFATPENLSRFDLPEATWTMFVGMRPRSRGRVYLTSADPADQIGIDAGYLKEPADLESLKSGLACAREIGNADALRSLTTKEVMPGHPSEQALEDYFRNGLVTFWHQCGTAAMGTDEQSVVDGALKVHGVLGLRVADASVLPHVTVGNTMAPCVVIGERAAEMLLADHT